MIVEGLGNVTFVNGILINAFTNGYKPTYKCCKPSYK